ncbi:outer membrane protein assembly factor BamB family protein [Chloroflexus sp.]|uniref:outer membrane protein assembly factor BamB family protein n=1 Tax=Chloroflexus sp. TaxID=1904827 RepID=UPI00262A6D1D|nr:PQQ-binding-like beta-propeller repeat protein [uncultured Chloroflexus sp.]
MKVFLRLITMLWLVGSLLACAASVAPISSGSIALPTPTSTSTATPIQLTQTVTRTYLPLIIGQPPPPPPSPAGWYQLAGNPQRTGYSPVTVQGPYQFRWIWNGPAGGGDTGPASDHLGLPKAVQPVIGNGLVFVGHSDGIARALRVSDGSLAWSRSVGGQVLGTVAYHPGLRRVFVGSTNGRLYSLNANDGTIVGSFNVGGPIEMSPLLVDDVIFVGSIINKGRNNGEGTSGQLVALNTADLSLRWQYNANAGLLASPAYTARNGGMIIIAAEDKTVRALRVSDGSLVWSRTVNAGRDPQRQWTAFPDTYPAVSEVNGVVIIRSYFMWQLTWAPPIQQTATVESIRTFLSQNPSYQSFFVLDLDTGQPRYVAPVLGGGIGNNDDYYSTPPQAVIRRLSSGSEVAYVTWRNSQACLDPNNCDSREEGAVGEMDLTTGNIRFIDVDKNGWQWRMPVDELGSMTMAGDALFYSHWMSMAGVKITDRSPARGSSVSNPILTSKLVAVTNSLAPGTCNQRNSAQHYCPTTHYDAGGGYLLGPGFYIYYTSRVVYDEFFTPPVFGPAIDENGVIYWKSVDGAIIALTPQSATTP